MFEGFGVSKADLVCPRCVWNASPVRLTASGVRLGGVFGLYWAVLGGSWRGFGESWRLPGSFLTVLLEDFLPT